ncbi:phage tail protein [Photobacterium leiognathi]|uniref:phage tail protein n=1 Tax=Photobacterium leiognathi TaxID=553611 RepID=UPI00020880D7|nr:phage tail protein [Photobacterium leiognathi]PSW48326.1 phage tail protein [Photobacterium leiognathi subsp. mandapamensis]GAA03239.1 phage tail protein [Photobacterium leiognathi subsp. mandapamensis svers.1.1.]
MGVSQNLRTVVTLGGAVDSSFGKMAGTVDKELGKATKQVKSLEREQQKLAKQIKKAKLAGADVRFLTRRYEELGNQINDAAREAEGFDAAGGIGKGLRNGAVAIGATSGAVIGLTSAMGGLVAITNAQTAEQAGLAKSYGMTIEQYKAWGSIAAQAGLNAENTGDLVEELTNKIGEFKALGKQSSVSDVFGKLGIQKSMLEGLSAAEQFEFVMRRLEKVKDGQQAASLADMLFGGEGNKVVTYLRNSGKSLDDLLNKQKTINNLTQKGADGAAAYNTAWNSTLGAVTSSWQEVSGVVGGEMAPVLDALGVEISAYFKANKAAIVSFATGIVTASINLSRNIVAMAVSVNDVVDAFGGWQSVGAVVAGMMAGKMAVGIASTVGGIVSMVSALGSARSVMLGLNVVMAANPIGAVAAAVGLLTTAGLLLYQNWDSVVEWFAGKLEWFKTEFPATFSTLKTVFDWSPLGMIINHWDKVPDYFSGLWGNVTAIFDKYLGKVKAIWSTVSGFVDDLKFWQDDDDSKPKATTRTDNPTSYSKPSYTGYSGYGDYASRAASISSTTAPASNSSTKVYQTVEKIEVNAAPGQSPQSVGQAVATQLSDSRDGAMYDTLSSD